MAAKPDPSCRPRDAKYSLVDLTEGDLLDLVAGFVPAKIKGMACQSLDYHAEDVRRANRPLRKAK